MSGLLTPTGRVIYQGPALTPEWHEARRHGVSASEIAAVVGISPWESRFSLHHRKAGTIPAQPDSPRMASGRMLEGVVREWFSVETRSSVVAPNVVLAHADRSWQKCSPDGLTYAKDPVGGSVVEAKTSVTKNDWGQPGTDQVPPYYRTQTLWQMDVTGWRRAYIPVLFGDLSFEYYVVDYDADEAAWLREQAKDFLDDLDTGRQPDIDSHTATYTAVRQLHPDIDGGDYQLTGELADRYRLAKLAFRSAEDEDRLASALVLDAMGSARRAMFDSECLARREARNGGTPYLKSALKTSPKEIAA